MTKLPNPFPSNPNVFNPLHPTPASVEAVQSDKITKAGFNGTLITFVLDESGSMGSCLNDTITGFNSFIDEQRKKEGKCEVSLFKFAGRASTPLFQLVDINETPALSTVNYRPGGGTPLLDAIGDAIQITSAQLKSRGKKKDRPAALVIIMTDGEENESRRFTNEQIKSMVAKCEKADWTFIFLGANIDAFSVGSGFGFAAGATMAYSTSKMGATMAAVNNATTNYRSAKMKGMTNEDIMTTDCLFSDSDRDSSL